jgi:predicted AlkP superfamily pyrophosphatase or phosphodiesterase
MCDMRRVAPTVCRILGVRPPSSSEIEPLVEVVKTMGSPVRLAVVVIDAFGVSTWTAARKETPTFNLLANRHLLRLRSVMPTITPVNFATMLTGASPDAHKIRVRTERLMLETIFDVLRENGKTSATAARSMSSLGILISPFADHPGLAESNTDKEVCALALKALRNGVDLLWVQLLDVDDAGHQYGPLSTEGIEAAHRADNHLREIAVAASEGGFGLIVLADHGQHTISRDDGSEGGTHGTDVNEDIYVPFVWCTALEAQEALGS